MNPAEDSPCGSVMTMARLGTPPPPRLVKPPVVVIDGHELFGASLTFALRDQGFDANHLAASAGAAAIVRQVDRLPVGLALLDLHLGHDKHGRWLDAVGLVGQLHARHWAVLILGGSRDSVRMAGAVAAGAIGTVSKSDTLRVLLDSVFAAAAGGEVMPDAERSEWLRRYQSYQTKRRELDQHLARLTPRERKVLELLDQGSCAQTIAEQLVVSLTTVRAQIRSILAKLEVNSQLEAVALLNVRSLL